jgi:hypothetical protein
MYVGMGQDYGMNDLPWLTGGAILPSGGTALPTYQVDSMPAGINSSFAGFVILLIVLALVFGVKDKRK